MIKPIKGLDVIGLKVLRMLLNASCKNNKYCVCFIAFTKNILKRMKCAHASPKKYSIKNVHTYLLFMHLAHKNM